jgi:photosystem II stability/assembly factor-like uncharacterized protein
MANGSTISGIRYPASHSSANHAVLSVAESPPTTGVFTYTSLEHIVFSNLRVGYGLFASGSNRNNLCQYFVGKTHDSGAHFGPLVRLGESPCGLSGVQSLVIDGGSNGFAFGPELFETHNSGGRWSKETEPGQVLAVAPTKSVVWMVRAQCPTDSASPQCPLRVLRSSNGGRTWTPTRSQPAGASANNLAAQGQDWIVSIGSSTAYLLTTPTLNGSGSANSVPFWFTQNRGQSWSPGAIPCSIDAVAADLSVAPDGALVAVCSSQLMPPNGTQVWSVAISTDEGRTWRTVSELAGANQDDLQDQRNFDFFEQVAAISSTSAYVINQLGVLLQTTDGGSSWRVVLHVGTGSSGGAQLEVLSERTAFALVNGGSVQSTLAHTSDGGLRWTLVRPRIVRH